MKKEGYPGNTAVLREEMDKILKYRVYGYPERRVKIYKKKISGFSRTQQKIYDIGMYLTIKGGGISSGAKREAAERAVRHLERMRECGRTFSLDINDLVRSLEYCSGDVMICSDAWASMRGDHPAARNFSSVKITIKGDTVFYAVLEEFGPDGILGHIKKCNGTLFILKTVSETLAEYRTKRIREAKEYKKALDDFGVRMFCKKKIR